MMKFALWFSVVVTFFASWFLGLIGVGIWLVFWVLFWLIFRKNIKKLSAPKTEEEQAASDARWAKAAEAVDRMNENTQQMQTESEQMKADRKRVSAVRKAEGWRAAEELRKQQNAARRAERGK